MPHPLVSVLVPVGPVEAHVAPALESLTRQTFDGFEVRLVLDGAGPRARDAIAACAARDPRFHVEENPGTGLVDALSHGARRARGALLARFDADDVAHPERLARQVAFLERHPELAICATRWHLVTDGPPGGGFERYRAWQESLDSPEAIARERFYESPIAHPTVCMRRTAYEALGGYRDAGWPEDYDLWLRALQRFGACIGVVERDLHGWRDHEERHSRIDGRYAREAFLRCKAHHLARLPLPGADLWIWGAGPIGTRLARALGAEGVSVAGFVDVDPRKVGRTRGGRPIVSAEEGLARRPALILAAVGGEGSAVLRRFLLERGLRPGVEFLTVA